MGMNIRIAKELVRIARSLVADGEGKNNAENGKNEEIPEELAVKMNSLSNDLENIKKYLGTLDDEYENLVENNYKEIVKRDGNCDRDMKLILSMFAGNDMCQKLSKAPNFEFAYIIGPDCPEEVKNEFKNTAKMMIARKYLQSQGRYLFNEYYDSLNEYAKFMSKRGLGNNISDKYFDNDHGYQMSYSGFNCPEASGGGMAGFFEAFPHMYEEEKENNDDGGPDLLNRAIKFMQSYLDLNSMMSYAKEKKEENDAYVKRKEKEERINAIKEGGFYARKVWDDDKVFSKNARQYVFAKYLEMKTHGAVEYNLCQKCDSIVLWKAGDKIRNPCAQCGKEIEDNMKGITPESVGNGMDKETKELADLFAENFDKAFGGSFNLYDLKLN